jgi:hypothetical protein
MNENEDSLDALLQEYFSHRKRLLVDGINKDPIKPHECMFRYFERKYVGTYAIRTTLFGYSPRAEFKVLKLRAAEDFSEIMKEIPGLVQSHCKHIQQCGLCQDFVGTYQKHLQSQNPKLGLWQKICNWCNATPRRS